MIYLLIRILTNERAVGFILLTLGAMFLAAQAGLIPSPIDIAMNIIDTIVSLINSLIIDTIEKFIRNIVSDVVDPTNQN